MLSVPSASAQSTLMVWHNITDRFEKQHMKQYAVRPYADATTRLKTELKAHLDY